MDNKYSFTSFPSSHNHHYYKGIKKALPESERHRIFDPFFFFSETRIRFGPCTSKKSGPFLCKDLHNSENNSTNPYLRHGAPSSYNNRKP